MALLKWIEKMQDEYTTSHEKDIHMNIVDGTSRDSDDRDAGEVVFL